MTWGCQSAGRARTRLIFLIRSPGCEVPSWVWLRHSEGAEANVVLTAAHSGTSPSTTSLSVRSHITLPKHTLPLPLPSHFHSVLPSHASLTCSASTNDHRQPSDNQQQQTAELVFVCLGPQSQPPAAHSDLRLTVSAVAKRKAKPSKHSGRAPILHPDTHQHPAVPTIAARPLHTYSILHST